jgi:diguanylate cyclase (GGDEF)-like protein
MLDLDHFKQINDTYGHPVGDQALKALAHCCQHHLRSVDILGRYGGEEFLALLPETECEAAIEAAERIRKQVENQVLSSERGPVSFTISLGVATAAGHTDATLDDLIKNADDALYEAKRNGRNRVCYADL